MNGELAQAVTYRARHPVAYLTHPGADAAHHLGRLPGLLTWLPQVTRGGMTLPPVVTDTLRVADNPERPAGWVITLPVTDGELRAGTPRAMRVILRAIERARGLGAQTVGLGGLTALATGSGLTLRGVEDVGLTTGDAYAAALTFMSVQRLLAHAPADTPVAIVGAGGGVGRCVATLLARRTERPLLLAGRHDGALRAVQAALGGGRAQITAELRRIHACGLVVLLGRAGTDLRAAHLGPDAIVLDGTHPRMSWPELLLDRPDVRIVDGPQASVPGLRRGGGEPFREHSVPACLAGTLLLGLSGHAGHFTLGAPLPEQAEVMLGLAARFASLGFRPAAPRSFGAAFSVSRRFELEGHAGGGEPRRTDGPAPGVSMNRRMDFS